MSITPKITSRNSPLCTSINKNLLTPCRRIGLSRKRKTPNSIVQMLSENSPISSSDSILTETMPEEPVALLGNDDTCNNLEQDDIDLQVDFIRAAKILSTEEIVTEIAGQDLSQECEKYLESKPSQTKISEESIISEGNDSDDDFKIIKRYSHKQKRKVDENRKRKTKRTYSECLRDQESEDVNSNGLSNITRECIVKLQKINENKMNQQNPDIYSIPESLKESIDVMMDDEEDAFTSTPEQEKFKKSDILQKIKALEKVTQQKRQHLVDLSQASIYKKKHSIEDLNQLTSKWMTGCISGLIDLLTQLQAHGPMHMTTLLQNLHIPEEIVAKLSLTLD